MSVPTDVDEPLPISAEGSQQRCGELLEPRFAFALGLADRSGGGSSA